MAVSPNEAAKVAQTAQQGGNSSTTGRSWQDANEINRIHNTNKS